MKNRAESSLKQRVLAAFASESGAIVKAARVLDGAGFNDAGGGIVPRWYDTLTAWMKGNTPAGGVVAVQKAP